MIYQLEAEHARGIVDATYFVPELAAAGKYW